MSVTDYKGNIFPRLEDMCAEYNICVTTYQYRLAKGWTQEKALTTKANAHAQFVCDDGFGNTFSSQKAMLGHYGIQPKTYRTLIKKGLTKEQIIEQYKAKVSTKVSDKEGNTYNSRAEMARAHGVERTALNRLIKKGVSPADAVEELKRKKQEKEDMIATDHNGKTWETFSKMCDAYGQDHSTVKNRLDKGWTMEDALTKQARKPISVPITDPYGQVFQNVKIACDHYGINPSTFSMRKLQGDHYDEELFGIAPWFSQGTVYKDAAPGLMVIRPLTNDISLFLCELDGHDLVLSRLQIVNECKDRNRDKYLIKELN